MVHVEFTPNLRRHIACEPREVEGRTVRDVLDAVFAGDDLARSYVLDDQHRLRKHMVVFNNGVQVHDRVHLSDPVAPDAEVLIFQALSGG